MTDCIFCKIINGEIPATKIYENNYVLAFLDIAPVNPGHTLIIPKQHSKTLLDTLDNLLGEITIAIKKVSEAIMKATNAKGFNIVMNNLKAAGQLVDHAHIHIIPRFSNDGLKPWPSKSYKENEAEVIAKKIRSFLK